ncbi:MAG: PIG-L family deacetylase [Bacteroidia bacterium]|nr:PIG-L family deacetylase [Bacteroidia bacterium]
MIEKSKKILVLAPHTDDAEFGCGATIAKLIENGNDVYCAAFSACEQSVLKDFPSDILITEVKLASEKLGVKSENLFLYDFEVRTFNFRRQEILDKLIKLRETIHPDIVFIPSLNDLHQDHATISNEALRAFKFCSILCYELPWNNISFSTSSFMIIEEKHLDKKIQALNEYKSQAHRPYAKEDFIKALAKVRGVQISRDYAEAFEILRWLL